jgi:hypothetical protein
MYEKRKNLLLYLQSFFSVWRNCFISENSGGFAELVEMAGVGYCAERRMNLLTEGSALLKNLL